MIVVGLRPTRKKNEYQSTEKKNSFSHGTFTDAGPLFFFLLNADMNYMVTNNPTAFCAKERQLISIFFFLVPRKLPRPRFTPFTRTYPLACYFSWLSFNLDLRVDIDILQQR